MPGIRAFEAVWTLTIGKPCRPGSVNLADGLRSAGSALRHVACSSARVLDRLNALLQGELAAVAGYQKTLGTMKRNAAADCGRILSLAADHQRAVAVLHASVVARGGVPAVATDDRTQSSVGVVAGGDASVTLESGEFVSALLEAERRGLGEYEAALGGLDDEARDLVQLELMPRQRRIVAGLVAIFAVLAA